MCLRRWALKEFCHKPRSHQNLRKVKNGLCPRVTQGLCSWPAKETDRGLLKNVCFKATKLVVILYQPQNKTLICVHPVVDSKQKKTAIWETTSRAGAGGGEAVAGGNICHRGDRGTEWRRRIWAYRPHKGGVKDRPRTLIKIRKGTKQNNYEVGPRAMSSGIWAHPWRG